MTFFETANELQLRLDAASTADKEDVLLSRGRTVRDAIVAAKEHFEAAQSYRVTTGPTDAPPLNTKAIRQAIGHFRGALSKSSPNAFQQRPAATLEEVLAAQTRRVDHWIKSTWGENFAGARALLERVDSGDLHGPVLARTKAQNRAAKIEAVLNLNPVKDRAMLEAHLNAVGLDACIESSDRRHRSRSGCDDTGSAGRHPALDIPWWAAPQRSDARTHGRAPVGWRVG